MADDIIDAHEQSERARQWLQQNGGSIVIGILLALAALVGYQRWDQSSVNHRAEALIKFENLTAALDKSDTELAQSIAEDLRKNYGGTAHAGLAALKQADMANQAGQLDDAEAALRFAAEQGKPESVRTIAKLRLARVVLAKGSADQALAILDGAKLAGFGAEREAVRGDALAALGRRDEALSAYDQALAETDVAAPSRRWLQMRRDELASSGLLAQAATPAPAAPVSPAADAELEADTETAAPEQGS